MNGLKAELSLLSTNKTFEKAVAYVSTVVALYVGKAVLKQTALLLPIVHEM